MSEVFRFAPLKLIIFSKFPDMIFKLSSQSVIAHVQTLSLKSLLSPPLGFYHLVSSTEPLSSYK